MSFTVITEPEFSRLKQAAIVDLLEHLQAQGLAPLDAFERVLELVTKRFPNPCTADK